MKIVDVSEFYSPTGGGVRSYVDHKFEAAAKSGVGLTVIAPGVEDRIEPRPGGRLLWVATPQLPFDKNYRMFWGARRVLELIDHERPDVVEGSSPWRGGWIASRWRGNAVKMLFMHQDPIAVYPQTLLSGLLSPTAIDRLFAWYWAYLRKLNARFDGCVVAGRWLADRFSRYGLENLHVVPFGIEKDWFGPGLRDAELRRAMLAQCGLGADAALLVQVGRHHPEKRVGTVIDAVSIAQRTRPIGLYVIGDGFIHKSIVAKAARASHVHIAGWVRDRAQLARMIASADVLLHGSSAETYGFVVAEALHCGTPVVVPESGGAADLAGPDFAAAYPAGNAKAAASALLALLARDRESLSRAALQSAQSRIGNIESHFENLFALYDEAVRSKRAAGRPQGSTVEDAHAST